MTPCTVTPCKGAAAKKTTDEFSSQNKSKNSAVTPCKGAATTDKRELQNKGDKYGINTTIVTRIKNHNETEISNLRCQEENNPTIDAKTSKLHIPHCTFCHDKHENMSLMDLKCGYRSIGDYKACEINQAKICNVTVSHMEHCVNKKLPCIKHCKKNEMLWRR